MAIPPWSCSTAMISHAAFVSRTTTTSRYSSPTPTAGITCCSTTNNNINDDDDNNDIVSATNNNKPQSRLARLAEDWLEEEEDELQLYWERFDDNKSSNNRQGDGSSSSQSSSSTEIHDNEAEADEDEPLLTTEQRLDRYYDRRGINKRREKEHMTEIQAALSKAKKASTPEQAISHLQEVQPYLQINSNLGGTVLLELAIALWQRDGVCDEALCGELLGNSHVRRDVQLLLKNGPPTKRGEDALWQGFSFFENSNGWWN